MDTNFKQALAEVFEILNYTPVEEKRKIPKKFMDFIINNMDVNYKVDIDFYDENWKENLKDDTKGILSLLYTSYIEPQKA